MEKNKTHFVHLAVIYRAYQAITKWYLISNHRFQLLKRVFIEGPIRLIAFILGWLFDFRFPTRAIGGWWWIWRYRFEMLVGWYEYPTTFWMRKLIQPGMVVADIGAHVGYFSCLLSRLVGPTGKVLAFEPSPENFPILVHNLSRQRYYNSFPYQVAVSDKKDHALLYISPGHSNHSLVSGFTKAVGTINIETISIDQFLASNDLDNIDLVKIDVEGAEHKVLTGMVQLLSNANHLAIIIEVNPNALHAAGSTPQILLTLLASYGFLTRQILPNGDLADSKNQNFGESPNFLCLRPTQWVELLKNS
jgi:FkbM family methyltransferase